MKLNNYLFIICTFISSVVFPQTGVTTSRSFMSGGVSRTYTYYVPSIYNTAGKAVPVVYSIHGLGGTATTQAQHMDFRLIADTANFIIVNPNGLATGGLNLQGWNSMGTVASGAADRAFLMSLLDTIKAKYNIDANRIYTCGFSQGGFMSYNLCSMYSSHFAAMASVSASLTHNTKNANQPIHPLPVLEIHGTTDATISYSGSASYMHVDTLIQHWVKFNNCTIDPLTSNISDINLADSCNAIHYVYSGGTNNSSVELIKIVNGGHQVPQMPAVIGLYGFGNKNLDFSASKEIWRFLSQYTLDNLMVGVTRITENEFENSTVSIYPNPSNGVFTVELKYISNANLTVYNMLGEEVLTEKLSNKLTTINLGNASAGVYFYHVSSATGIITSGKLIIE